jgi:cysteine synthase A
MVHCLAKREGLLLGSSSAINVCAAAKLARERGRGQVIVTVLADGGTRYLSRLFNPAWLAEKGLTPRAKGLEFLSRV